VVDLKRPGSNMVRCGGRLQERSESDVWKHPLHESPWTQHMRNISIMTFFPVLFCGIVSSQGTWGTPEASVVKADTETH
jgi:hypothetical protein